MTPPVPSQVTVMLEHPSVSQESDCSMAGFLAAMRPGFTKAGVCNCSAQHQSPCPLSACSNKVSSQHPGDNTVDGRFTLASVACEARRAFALGLSKLKAGVVWRLPQTQASSTFCKALGCTLGDFVAQNLNGGVTNALHSLQLGIYGTLLDTPFPAVKTSGNITCTAEKQSAASVAAPAPADFLWMPAIACLTAALIKLLAGQPDLILSSCQDKLVSLAATNYILWPLTHYINANIVPKQFQSRSNLLIHMTWSACLSGLGHAPCITSLAGNDPIAHVVEAAGAASTHLMPGQAAAALVLQTATSDAINPIMQCAAGAIEVAVRRLETIPSTLTQEALSKSLDIILNVEEMAKSPLHANAGKHRQNLLPA